MTTRLIFVRHGQTLDNKKLNIQGWSGTPLTSTGKRQAKSVADKLDRRPDMIFTSDLERCAQTAHIIHKSFPDIPLLIDWRLRERSFGSLEGQHRDTIDFEKVLNGPPLESPYGVEPAHNLQERLKSFMRDTESFACDTILVVCHGGVLNHFGYLLDSNYEHRRYDNTEIISYDINHDDTRLLPGKINYWNYTNATKNA